MRVEDAIALIRPAVVMHEGIWADLGAGTGLFTRALVHVLGSESHVLAVDRDPAAFAELERFAAGNARVTAIQADFTTDFASELPLDGVLLPNALEKFTVVESRPSNYEGIIYAAVASLRGAAPGR